MSKVKLNELSEQELINMNIELNEDINKLNAIIEASNSTVFDLLIDETKKEMKANVLEESWKKLKENIKKIEQYRTIETTLQNQQDLLERKKDELEDVNNALMYRQQNLFDSEAGAKSEEIKVEDTGYKFGSTLQPIETGDIFVNKNSNPEAYYFIQKSKDKKNFVIIGNSIEDELLLNYPKNREFLNDATYIGNIYYGEDDKEEAIIAYKKLNDSLTPSS